MAEKFYLKALNYHYVRDTSGTPFAKLNALDPDDFIRQLDSIMLDNDMISWHDLRNHIRGGKALPKKACLLTFDDGLKEHYSTVFPALKERKASGLFFPVARIDKERIVLAHKLHFLLATLPFEKLEKLIMGRLGPEEGEHYLKLKVEYASRDLSASYYDDVKVAIMKKILQDDMHDAADTVLSVIFRDVIGSVKDFSDGLYLNDGEMKKMAEGGMYFGGHGSKHLRFSVLDKETQDAEAKLSRNMLAGLQDGPWAFSYPYGAYSGISPEILGRHGFVAAFTVRNKTIQDDFYLLGRVDARSINVSEMKNIQRREG